MGLPGLGNLVNAGEYAIHHEDVRRAQPGWQPRRLAAADEVVLLRDVPKSPEDPATCLTTGDPSLTPHPQIHRFTLSGSWDRAFDVESDDLGPALQLGIPLRRQRKVAP